MSVVTPTTEKACGLFPAGAGGGMGGDSGGFDFAASSTTAKASPVEHRKGKRKVETVKLPADCLVRGRVKACKGGAMTIICGKTSVRASWATVRK